MELKNKKPARVALGRGLSALISQKPVPISPSTLQNAVLSHMHEGSAAINTEQASAPDPMELIEEVSLKVSPGGVNYLSIDLISNNPSQPRQQFVEEDLNELVESIKTLGVLQPVIVRPRAGTGTYEIVAGERRWRAAKRVGLAQLPVIIREISDRDCLEIALVENIQRANLNPVEEATGYQRLISEFG